MGFLVFTIRVRRKNICLLRQAIKKKLKDPIFFCDKQYEPCLYTIYLLSSFYELEKGPKKYAKHS